MALIWRLAAALPVQSWITTSLAGGWLLMPAILGVSLRWPRLRYALVLPSVLVSVGLLAVCVTAPAETGTARAGWLLTTVGVLMGGGLGIWFWFRWLPIPSALLQPFSRGRWALIAIHVSLIVAGLALVSLATIA